MMPGGKTRSMFTQLVYEFLNKNENYNEVLGYIEPDGCRVRGLYDQFAISKVSSVSKPFSKVLEAHVSS